MGARIAPGPVAVPANIATAAQGLEYLGGARLAAGATSLASPTFAARDGLLIAIEVPSRSAAATLLMRFNGDSAANYWTRTFTSGQIIGVATFANNQTASATSLILDAGDASTDSTHFFFAVGNRTATSKVGFWSTAIGSGAVGTIPTVCLGVGEWVNTLAQITQATISSTATLNAGTQIMVFGRNYP